MGYDPAMEGEMRETKAALMKKLKHDENLILKLIGEIGDLVRYMREMEARIMKLEKRANHDRRSL